MERINITIIGAGVVGLAVGYELSKKYRDIFIIEKNFSFGQETSSRNSEVIHSGIYYPQDSLKAKTCREGKILLYDFCLKYNIPHKKIGKFIVANSSEEESGLYQLFQQGLNNGVEDLRLIANNEIKNLEPNIRAKLAIYSGSTGIIDTHSLMKNLSEQFNMQGGNIVYNIELVSIEKKGEDFILRVRNGRGEEFNFLSRIVVNSAGLNSDKIAEMAGIIRDEYKLKYCKGDYFRVHNNKARFINRLIYPVPKKERAGLGIHATLDLGGGLRLGPDDEYVDRIGYNVDESKKKIFYESVREFLPFIEQEDLSPDISGIRPRLQGPREDFRDFIINDEFDFGLPGLINLIGIESPGLTACLCIARIVREMVRKYF
ncbi:MAG: NAD(P)/FAD-dependent oxidoreductase [Candidatus Omnitrophica bacterium]|nr:NAD(P)/FAD-dependent oxidoreductase [Candidatus Omnitrophota bacterium]MCM8794057.1 NAD(P)/FAD-dependent oxidoreductase [Candidatus Omnitrophota bacterium]